MTEIWVHSKKTPDRLAATVASDRARHVAKELNDQGFKVRLVSVTAGA